MKDGLNEATSLEFVGADADVRTPSRDEKVNTSDMLVVRDNVTLAWAELRLIDLSADKGTRA